MDALNGNGYVFIGRRRKSLKILRWQKEGFVLYNKKLELGCYTLPQQVGGASFFEVESTILDQIVNTIRQKSNSNELRLKATLIH